MQIEQYTKDQCSYITGLGEEQLFDSLYLAIKESDSPTTSFFTVEKNKTVLAWGHPLVFSSYWDEKFSFFVRLEKDKGDNLYPDYPWFRDHPVYIVNKGLRLIQESLGLNEKKEFDDELLYTMVISGCWAQTEAIERMNSFDWLHKLALSEKAGIRNQKTAIARIFDLPVIDKVKISELKKIKLEATGQIAKYAHLKIKDIKEHRLALY